MMDFDNKNIEYISVIGVDGSGKSTWFKEIFIFLEKKRKIVGIGDKILFNGNKNYVNKFVFILWQFFWRTTKKVKKKLFYKIVKIIELILRVKSLKLVIKNNPIDTVVSDGAPLINILAWGSIYYPNIFTEDLCTKAFEHLSGKKKMGFKDGIYYLRNSPEIFLLNILGVKFFIPNVVIFLEISPKEAIRRIELRGKDLQFHETEEKLNQLQNGYFKVTGILESNLNIKVIRQNVDNLSMSDNINIIRNNFNL